MLLLNEIAGFAIKEILEVSSVKLLGMLSGQVQDHGERVNRALQQATYSAWRALEIALAGESLWTMLSRQEDKVFRQKLRDFIDAVPLPLLTGKTEFRRQCLDELKKARKNPQLTAPVSNDMLARRAQALAQYTNPQDVIQVETQVLKSMAKKLDGFGYKSLAWLLSNEAQPSQSVLVIASRFYFRRQVENDEILARGLQFSQLEGLSSAQKSGFEELDKVLKEHGSRLDEALENLMTVVTEARDAALGAKEAASGAHSAVLDLQAEMQKQIQGMNSQVQALYEPVMRLLAQIQAQNQPVNPSHSLSIRNDREKAVVRELLAQYRNLPSDQKAATPALLNGLGKLNVAVGDFDTAQNSFEQVAKITKDRRARGEAYFNAYRSALEMNRHDDALKELLKAVHYDQERFAPFPMGEYEPIKILGAGGFGVTFLCRHKLSAGMVAVKALMVDDLERDVTKVFEEAQTLDSLQHPGIIRLRHCGFADGGRTRPYLVMDYFQGMTLEEYVKKNGVIAPPQLIELARLIAGALQAAHSKGILHRDIKPANILVRQNQGAWEIRVIDFGLALKQSTIDSATSTFARGQTIVGSTIAGTLDYAAPEQIGKLPGVRVGIPADVFGFARTCCYARFGAPEPTFQDWQKLPRHIAELLGECLNKQPDNRPANLKIVMERLTQGADQSHSGGTPPPPSVVLVEQSVPVIKPVIPVVQPSIPTVKPSVAQVEPSVPVAKVLHDVIPMDYDKPPRSILRNDGARKMVHPPGVALLIVGILGAGFNLFMTVFIFGELGDSTTPPAAVGIFYLTGAVASVIALLGGIAMMNMRSYTLAFTGSICAMYGGCICLLTGVGIGIWCVVVLSKAEVRDAFQ